VFAAEHPPLRAALQALPPAILLDVLSVAMLRYPRAPQMHLQCLLCLTRLATCCVAVRACWAWSAGPQTTPGLAHRSALRCLGDVRASLL